MTESLLMAAGTAVWLGVLTSISPCPLAANIAAIGYIGRDVKSPGGALWRGVSYTLGRSISYVVLSIIIVTALLAVPDVALFLQNEFNVILGPILLLVGLILLRVLRLPVSASGSLAVRLQNRIRNLGVLGALLLGILFALSFCPISAALYFGSLIPLSLERNSPVLLPLCYALGTAAPVVIFAVLLAFGAHLVGRAYNTLTVIERWARPVTGLIFVVVGLYYCWEYWIAV